MSPQSVNRGVDVDITTGYLAINVVAGTRWV